MFDELKNLCDRFNVAPNAAREIFIEAIYKEAINNACLESEYGMEFENDRDSIIEINKDDSELLIRDSAASYIVVRDYDELCIAINKLVWKKGNNQIIQSKL